MALRKNDDDDDDGVNKLLQSNLVTNYSACIHSDRDNVFGPTMLAA